MQTRIYQIDVHSKEYHKNMIRNCVTTAVVVGIIMLLFLSVALFTQAQYYENELISLENKHMEEVDNIHQSYASEIASLNKTISDQKVYTETVVSELSTLKEQKEADSRYLFEIAQKYWYVLRDAPSNSGLTMDNLVYQDNLAKEKDLNPHIMWCIYDIESDYTVRIDNKTSSARGIGQVLASTGKSLYENTLQLGTYKHTMAYDAETNMTLSTELIARNIGGGLYNSIALYSGDSSGGYYNQVLATAKNHRVSITDTSYQ